LSATELGPGRFRFVHIDGSHTYEAVARDIDIACELASEGGVLVFDDYANDGHPGVAAALWPAVMRGDLTPFASSPSKLYTTFNDDWAIRYRRAVEELAAGRRYPSKVSELPGSAILSVWPTADRRSLGIRVARRIKRLILQPAPYGVYVVSIASTM
jgi:hypothetical protein